VDDSINLGYSILCDFVNHIENVLLVLTHYKDNQIGYNGQNNGNGPNGYHCFIAIAQAKWTNRPVRIIRKSRFHIMKKGKQNQKKKNGKRDFMESQSFCRKRQIHDLVKN